jgi:small subunit ribosomal protein S5
MAITQDDNVDIIEDKVAEKEADTEVNASVETETLAEPLVSAASTVDSVPVAAEVESEPEVEDSVPEAAPGKFGDSRPEGRGRGDGRRGRRDRGDRGDREPVEKEFVEKLVKLNRTAKVVKGGRRFSFSALTVIGDRKGRVGYGFGKANDVSEAIRKSIDKAKRNMINLPVKNGTIPHEVLGRFKASHVLLKPACSGTGIIAGGPVRAIMEAGGVTDVLSKSIGSSSQYNVVKATFDCINRMMDARTISRNRGKSLNELWG